MGKQLTATLEDYLEAIYQIESEKKVARVRDISSALDVAKSTVVAALRSLADKELVNYEPYKVITLTAPGRDKASAIVVRHQIIRGFLQNVLGFEPDQADSIACGMEHSIDREALGRFVCFLAFIADNPPKGPEWLDEFKRFCREGPEGETCKDRIEQYMKTLQTETETERPDG